MKKEFKFALADKNKGFEVIKTFDNLESVNDYFNKFKDETELAKLCDPEDYYDLVKLADPQKEVGYNNVIVYNHYFMEWRYLKQQLEDGSIDEDEFNNSMNEIAHQERVDFKNLKKSVEDDE